MKNLGSWPATCLGGSKTEALGAKTPVFGAKNHHAKAKPQIFEAKNKKKPRILGEIRIYK